MKTKKRMAAILLAAVTAFCLVLSGCGNGGRTDTYQDVIDWENVDWEGVKDSSSVIKLFISNDLQKYFAPKIEAFESQHKQYSVDVHWGAAGDGVKSEQTTAISTGDPPDLILGGDVHIENQKGFLLPLNKLIERDAAEVRPDDFIDGLLDDLTSGEGVYYLPYMFNVSVLMYNKKLFDSAQLAYPTGEWTFDDFVAAGKRLTVFDRTGAAVQWGNQTVTEWWTQWYSLYVLEGGSLFDDEGYVSLNNPAGIRALENWRRTVGVQGLPNAQFPDKIGTHMGTDGGNLGNFAGGKVGMLYSAHTGQLMTFSNAPGLDFDIAPLPKSVSTGSNEGTELSIGAYGIHKNSKNKKGAWELLKFLTAPRTDLDDLAAFANPVPRKSERDRLLTLDKSERPTKYKNLEVIYDGAAKAKALPGVAYFEEVAMQYLVPEVNKMFDGTHADAAAAAKAAEDTANAYIRYRYKMDF